MAEKAVRCTEEDIKKGNRVGMYDTQNQVVNYNYLIIDIINTTIRVVNMKTDVIYTCHLSDLYKHDTQKLYLDYDQEIMKKDDKVCFKKGTEVYKITKINAGNESCDLFKDCNGVGLFDIPLAYLKFANKEDSVKEEKLKEERNKKKSKKEKKEDKIMEEIIEKKEEEIKAGEALKECSDRFNFDDFKINITLRNGDVIVRCKDDKYSGVGILKDYLALPYEVRKAKLKDDLKLAINNAYDMFMDEDRRKRVDIFVPKDGDHYCRFNKVGLAYDEANIEWRMYNKHSLDCLSDLELGNMYRDGHEAKSDYNRLKNDISQRSKQIIENRKKIIDFYNEEE